MKKPLTKAMLLEIIKDLPDTAIVIKSSHDFIDGTKLSVVAHKDCCVSRHYERTYEYEDEEGVTHTEIDDSLDEYMAVGDKYLLI
jgi:hypothetical protein